MFHKFMFTILPIAIVAILMVGDLPANEWFQGTIVEKADNYITVQVADQDLYETFIVEPETTITLNGAPATIYDLLPNYEVEVTAERDGAAWFARTIEATSPAAEVVPFDALELDSNSVAFDSR